jgi:predicted AlkP superfamily pyrophosphatase or phosphodiesterase
MTYSSTYGQNLQRPKLVVGIVVDQMRWDFLYRYYNNYSNNGFRRLIKEGNNHDNMTIDYLPSVTANGHTAIWTGSIPALSGINGNDFYVKDKRTYCTDDHFVKSVGTDDKCALMSPHYMRVSTIGDELKLATDFKSHVISIALKDRSAILSGGHGADAAYWGDVKTGHFITSSYYMNELPKWVKAFNDRYNIPLDSLYISNKGIDITFNMAQDAIRNEKLGHNNTTDLLCMSISCTDKLQHKIGCRDKRIKDIYTHLDNKLASFLNYLDITIGKNDYIVFLTADHGAADNVDFLNRHKISGHKFDVSKIMSSIESELSKKYGEGHYIDTISDAKIYLRHNYIRQRNIDITELKSLIVNKLRYDDDFAYVFDLEKIVETSIPDIIKHKVINGYDHTRGGDIQLIPQAQLYPNDTKTPGTTHYTWNPYDTHIPFIMMGWHIKHGVSNQECHITDIATTICSLLKIQAPNGCVGSPIM